MNAKKPFRLAVRAVVIDPQNRCLLIRRSPACRHFIGQWEWPGGKAGPRENFTSALAREVREETLLEVEICGLAGAAHFEMPEVHVITLCLETRMISGQVRLSEEHDAFAWVPLDELARFQFAPGIGDFMRDYARRKGALL